MKTSPALVSVVMRPLANALRLGAARCALLPACLLLAGVGSARASQAYGSINNFDTVNDTGVETHGFEIELDDLHSKDVSYTYDWNHYGTPKITEDNTDPVHPKVFVRYESGKATGGGWAAFTAVPAAPIAPTQGHAFTNPAVNFGGEHFGVGYAGVPTAILYHWLVDDGKGNLVLGPAVSVATPVFTYQAAGAGVPAQIQAAIVPPPAPVTEPIVLEFGHASWVKEVRTTTHNSNEVKLRDLVSPDAAFPEMKNWANGEPAEVEAEWQILQRDSGAPGGGANGELQGAPEPLNQGDEVVTRRYEFYEYVGPHDPETGEALADTVGPDGIHGVSGGAVDYSQTEIVGKFLGTQMSAADVDAPVGLVDHLQDGEVGVKYPDRTVVIAGGTPFTASLEGALPLGLSFDAVAGVLSGQPQEAGSTTFSISVTDNVHPAVRQTYILAVAPAGVALAPHSTIASDVLPANAGNVTGTGDVVNGNIVKVTAAPKSGYSFKSWSEAGVVLSTSPSYSFNVDANHALVANFAVAAAKSAQKISFTTRAKRSLAAGAFHVSATATSSLAVRFAVAGASARIAGGVVTPRRVGTLKITASQPGNSRFEAATPVMRTVIITK